MTKRTMIVLLDVNRFSNGRTIAEKMEGKTYDDCNAMLKAIQKEERINVHDGAVKMFSLSEFTSELNEDSVFTEGYWTTFVTLLT